jgi:uncharacterized protein with NAD-binding domain and iron-sulfur cluster
MKERVVIVGAGIAGLTAAHELVERGFEVHVYERKSACGGKAASTRKADRPREHGFRFFPGWYRHLPDTMKRIPYQGTRRFFEGASVWDNLTVVESNRICWSNSPSIDVAMHAPRSIDDARNAADLFSRLRQFELTPAEISFFMARLGQYVVSAALGRTASIAEQTWWEYLEAEGKSRGFQSLIHATTRLTIAAKADRVNADTIAKLAIRTLFNWITGDDRVLNGPTSEVFLDAWQEALAERGVEFHFDQELASIKLSNVDKSIEALRFTSVPAEAARKLRRLLPTLVEDWPNRDSSRVHARYESNLIFAGQLATQLKQLGSRWTVKATWKGIDDFLNDCARKSKTAPTFEVAQGFDAPLRNLELSAGEATETDVDARYFVFALPLEQMAYYINRSGTLLDHDPDLRRILQLVDHTDWMSGIQFYLGETFQSVRGHLVAADSPWGITALEQTQFWRDVSLPSEVKSIISVDISAWDVPGKFVHKEAFNCTDDEIALEVWEELKQFTARGDQPKVLRNEMLIKSRLEKGISFHVDESLVDLADRKKQGAYEYARSIVLSRETRPGGEDDEPILPYIWGPRLRFNVEPLLINGVGTAALRPDVRTGIRNMFLAGDYVRTETDLACMEGANEAGRRAVNALLDTAESSEKRVPLFSFVEQTLGADKLAALFAGENAATVAASAAKAGAQTAGELAQSAGRLIRGLFRI